jgi:hypothetical protein
MNARAVLSATALVFTVSLVSVEANAQTRGTINGTVRDSAGAIAFAEVSMAGTDAMVMTD